MNKTDIEWTDYTWNPVTGCLKGCSYCYAKRITERFPDNYPNGFEPTFWTKRLNDPKALHKPSRIFTVSMGDLFGQWVPKRWIEAVLEVIEACPQHTFQLLTKDPKVMVQYSLPGNVWAGVTVTSSKELWRLPVLTKCIEAKVKYLSVEPLRGSLRTVQGLLSGNGWGLDDLDWIIIGAQTGPNAIKPAREWVMEIIKDFDGPVFMKNNLLEAIPSLEPRREFPEVKT